MAMRIFTLAEFEAELARAGLEKTGETTRTAAIWKTPNGKAISAPIHSNEIPDFVLEDILRKLGLLYRMR